MYSTSTAVVIATYNRAGLLERCLRALAQQTWTPDQVIVVDDGSTDGTQVLLNAWVTCGNLPILALRQENTGPAAARNRGIRAAEADFVAFTDDDCEPDPGWLEALAETLAAAPPGYAGIGGRVLPAHTGLVADYMTFHRILEPPNSCSYLVTANCLYRRGVLVEVGGFDERVAWPGGEDPGLSSKVTDAGYRLGYCEQAVVRHHYREGLRAFARTFFRYGRGCRVVMDR